MNIDTGRVIRKLDEYLGRNDYVSAERLLNYWLAEAENESDKRGMLTVTNELIGLYRKTGREKEALTASENALELARELKLDGTVTMGTALVNAATAYKAFGQAEKALPLYEKAREIYEKYLPRNDGRLGGLYNNMALAVMDTGDYIDSLALFENALGVMMNIPGGEADAAITYCNLADLIYKSIGMEDGENEINDYLDKAEEMLNSEEIVRDGNYAFVCEKCAPVFGFYGRFMTEKELNARMRSIYERD